MEKSQLSFILATALDTEWGIEVLVSDIEVFKRRFYSTRKEDPAYAALSLRICPTDPDTKMWIVKNGKEETRAE